MPLGAPMTPAADGAEDSLRTQRIHALLAERRWLVSTAESLTGGALSAALTEVTGASAVVAGGVTCYSVAAKSSVLAVPDDLLAARGAVDPAVAAAMARGAAALFDTPCAVATTGVAGPGPLLGSPLTVPAGTVIIAVVAPHAQRVRGFTLDGDRPAVRAAAVTAALRLLLAVLEHPRR